MAENNQQSLVPENKGAITVPDHIKPSMQGRENVDSTDMVLARLRLSQYMSDWVKSGDGKAGDMVHSMSPATINWGNSVTIIPIDFFKSRLRWTPRNESPPPDSPAPWPEGPGPAETCSCRLLIRIHPIPFSLYVWAEFEPARLCKIPV